jgi:WD40 repeat protein
MEALAKPAAAGDNRSVASDPKCEASLVSDPRPDKTLPVQPDAATLPPSAPPLPTWDALPGRPSTAGPAPMGTGVPGYEVLDELGRGGMGVVYRARHFGLNRHVALKMILAGAHAGDVELTRFLAEAQALALLQHPNVVQVYDSGRHEGLPFMALELVPGGSLRDKLNGGPLPPRQAALFIEQVARGVHAAHEHGIIHRDLKPHNILLAADATPKVTDFGLAKRLQGEGEGEDAGLTRTGTVMGTPSYMAPEQAGGDGKNVGPAADVYALGAVLYECLTGRPPFQAANVIDTLLQVTTREPVPVRALQPTVPRDLETICLKCLAKEPPKRYPSAAALANDLGRWLRGEPILARPAGWLERAVRWCRRNPTVASLTALLALALLGGATVATFFAIRARDEADEARAQAHRADGEATANAALAAKEKLALEAAQKAGREAAQQLRLAENRRYAGLLRLAHLHAQNGDFAEALALLKQAPAAEAGWELGHLDRWPNGAYRALGPPGLVAYSGEEGVAFSPDGRLVASAGLNGVSIWGTERGELVFSLSSGNFRGLGVAFSRDGKLLASCGTIQKQAVVRVWDVTTGNEAPGGRELAEVSRCIAFTPDSRGLIVVPAQRGAGGMLSWELATGKELAAVPGADKAYGCVTVSPDGRWLAAEVPFRDKADPRAEVRIWDLAAGKPMPALKDAPYLNRGNLVNFAFSSAGRWIAVPGSGDGHVRVWAVETGALVQTLRGHTERVSAVAFSADSGLLASISPTDHTARVFDVSSGRELHRLRASWQPQAVAFSPGGRRLAVMSAGRVDLWYLDRRAEAVPLEPAVQGRPNAVQFLNDDRLLVARSDPVFCQFWDLSSRKQDFGPELFPGEAVQSGSVLPSPDGSRLAARTLKEFVVLDAQTGKRQLVLPNEGEKAGHPIKYAFSSDGSLLLTGERNGRVRVWELGTGKALHQFDLKPGHRPDAVCFDPRGQFVAVTAIGASKFLVIWEKFATTRVLEKVIRGDHMAVSPDGRSLVVSFGKFWVLDTATWEVRQEREVGRNPIRSLAFSHDGKRLFTGHDDGLMWVWDTSTWEQLLSLPAATGPVEQIAVSPGGRWLATRAGADLKLWEGGPP